MDIDEDELGGFCFEISDEMRTRVIWEGGQPPPLDAATWKWILFLAVRRSFVPFPLVGLVDMLRSADVCIKWCWSYPSYDEGCVGLGGDSRSEEVLR